MANAAASEKNGVVPGTTVLPVSAGKEEETPPLPLAGANAVVTPQAPAPRSRKPPAGRSVERGKGDRSQGARAADRANAEQLAADLADSMTEVKAREAEVKAEKEAREKIEHTLAEALEENRAMRQALLTPVLSTQVKALPANEFVPELPNGFEECHPVVIYTAMANKWRPVRCVVVGVQTWSGGDVLKVRPEDVITAHSPFGTDDDVEVERFAPVMMPADGALAELAERVRRASDDPKGAHAFGAVIVPVAQLLTDNGQRVIVVHRVWSMDLGPGSVAKYDGGPQG